ncbi:cilia- and flagella-associated protein 20-like [Nasonia vitripennis]|uniref:CFA20 domain-containing protein n=1 Tax=Nasonia vitripennis TaxID=7425 RepID=A0A7M7H5B0_NASVI|nr:cilia- and flagella-associated protein 20-like [Nasonia vitripennis]
MFRGMRQCGFIPVLQSFGSSPLELWDMKVQNGCVRRVTDEQVRALALELSGTNVSTCYLYCPKDPKGSLGIHMPYLVMIIKSMKKYFTFEITVLDDRNVHRRFRMSNFQKMNRIHHFCTSMPLCLHPGWNEIYFDLSDITRKAYKTGYVETTRIQIHANCRVRVIYFCDRIYEDKDIPQKLKIFLPTNHVCRKKKPEESAEKKDAISAGETDFSVEYEIYEEQDAEIEYEESEETEFLKLEESLKSLEESMADEVSLAKPASLEEEQTGPMKPVQEEEEEEEEEKEEVESVEVEGENVRPEENETQEQDEASEEKEEHESDTPEG